MIYSMGEGVSNAPFRDFDSFSVTRLSPLYFLEFSRASEIRVEGEKREVIMNQPGNTLLLSHSNVQKTT